MRAMPKRKPCILMVKSTLFNHPSTSISRPAPTVRYFLLKNANLQQESGMERRIKNFVTVLVCVRIGTEEKKKEEDDNRGDAEVKTILHALHKRHARPYQRGAHTRLSSEAMGPFIKDKRAPKCQRLMDTASSSLPPPLLPSSEINQK